jgi:exopolysaccharide biosynthesis polyprenyl glycosylphosphotransferase
LICFSLYGFILAISRIGIFSRTLFILEAVTTTVLLLGYFSLRLKWFPPRVGIVASMQDRFSDYTTIQWVVFDPLLPLPRDLDMMVLGETADKIAINPIAESVSKPHAPVIAEPDINELLSGRVALSKITTTLLAQLRSPRSYLAVKRVGELALSLILTPIIAIFCLFLGALVKIDSPGPVFFRQTRIGLNGSQFRIIKLRTMSHQSAQSGKVRFAEPGDQRVTRMGRWLRSYRLDELPQFWNILRGEMSLIGPRPEQPSFVDQFEKTIPLYLLRHAVRPGITGWAQVRYGYAASEEQTRTKLEYDLFYIKHMSVWLDFNIFLSTLHTVLLRKGAR